MSIKELIVSVYKANGFDTITACQHASEYINELKKEKPGTIWNLNSPAEGKVYSIRRD